MRILIVLALALSASLANPAVIEWTKLRSAAPTLSTERFESLRHLWDQFVNVFGIVPSYTAFQNFANNVALIWEHQKQSSSYQLGINQFAAMSTDEYKKLLGYRSGLKKNGTIPRLTYRRLFRYGDLPKSKDWRKDGAVTEVKNQGQCGSCWAFSATGAMEGQYFRVHDKLVSLSEQQLVDCSSKNYGCNGGLMDLAFEYAEKYGIELESIYPYHAHEEKCAYDSGKVVAKVKAIKDLQMYSEDELMEVLAHEGPVSIAINAGLPSFQMYHGGVYSDEDCDGSPNSLNHGVLAVGYGEEHGVGYWLVKNSWGPFWGENGYIRIKRANNVCGVTTAASIPVM